MAAHIVRCSYLVCRRAGGNVNPQHGKRRSALVSHINNIVRLSVGHGTRGTDTVQDTQVHIPVDRLTVSYSRSSGPGGQHVNKVSTKAEVRFHVQTADWIPEDVRQKVFEKNKNRINKAGELLVTSELSRSQQRNLSDCIQKISAIIAEASEKPREPTEEDVALRAARYHPVREDEQGATETEEDPFSYQEEQTSGL
ncbi:peptidyl-tRNA hydrolase ICT1, mitochondrial isoform X1 [Micropterus salmoides]|uniref:peptidyl-tRNA hydrolase ICT1, mitochondrial isoform X1 n=1 Tax=Micropterus salmoides TaxID=27706 RepID=UPI0018EC1CA1|nr:peptidyl-tRNA hydrolase ICT1, mitochondrial isoform X1 [Micropterus salmoides]